MMQDPREPSRVLRASRVIALLGVAASLASSPLNAAQLDVCRDSVENAIFVDKVAKYQRCMIDKALAAPQDADVRKEVRDAEEACAERRIDMSEFARGCAADAVRKIALDVIVDGTRAQTAELILNRRN